MFLYKNLFFSISSVISIPIMLIGINGGYFPAICRECLKSNWSSDFGHAETGNGAKKRLVLRREFFRSNFKVK